MVLLLTFADGHQEIIALPPGEDPNEVAAKREADTYELFNSLRDLVAYIIGDPNQTVPPRWRPRRTGR